MVARSVVPAESETMMELAGKVVLFVPPFETGTVLSVMAPPPDPRTSNDVPESGEVKETVEVAIVLT